MERIRKVVSSSIRLLEVVMGVKKESGLLLLHVGQELVSFVYHHMELPEEIHPCSHVSNLSLNLNPDLVREKYSGRMNDAGLLERLGASGSESHGGQLWPDGA